MSRRLDQRLVTRGIIPSLAAGEAIDVFADLLKGNEVAVVHFVKFDQAVQHISSTLDGYFTVWNPSSEELTDIEWWAEHSHSVERDPVDPVGHVQRPATTPPPTWPDNVGVLAQKHYYNIDPGQVGQLIPPVPTTLLNLIPNVSFDPLNALTINPDGTIVFNLSGVYYLWANLNFYIVGETGLDLVLLQLVQDPLGVPAIVTPFLDLNNDIGIATGGDKQETLQLEGSLWINSADPVAQRTYAWQAQSGGAQPRIFGFTGGVVPYCSAMNIMYTNNTPRP